MTVERIGQWLTMMANLGVVAGILFLAFEIRQNNDLLRAQGRAIGEENRMRIEIEIMQNPDLRRAIVKMNAGETLTPEEALLSRVFMCTNFNSWQATWLEYEAGLIDLDRYVQQWRIIFRNNDRMPGRWGETNDRYDPGFVAWMEENVVTE
jgi:hypothetical protein